MVGTKNSGFRPKTVAEAQAKAAAARLGHQRRRDQASKQRDDSTDLQQPTPGAGLDDPTPTQFTMGDLRLLSYLLDVHAGTEATDPIIVNREPVQFVTRHELQRLGEQLRVRLSLATAGVLSRQQHRDVIQALADAWSNVFPEPSPSGSDAQA
jgi:hypothetical protein